MTYISILKVRQHLVFRLDSLDSYFHSDSTITDHCRGVLQSKYQIIQRIYPRGNGYMVEKHRQEDELHQISKFLEHRLKSLHKHVYCHKISAYKILTERYHLALTFRPFGKRRK